MDDLKTNRPNDIGWKQFAIGIIEMLRWPAAVVLIFFLLRPQLQQLLGALVDALKS